ncbi:hypothetical protein E8E11_010597 [Didymella keratinophila]|nr:hypothetical protein E8E11_010597 [Didymella keratinophila]
MSVLWWNDDGLDEENPVFHMFKAIQQLEALRITTIEPGNPADVGQLSHLHRPEPMRDLEKSAHLEHLREPEVGRDFKDRSEAGQGTESGAGDESEDESDAEEEDEPEEENESEEEDESEVEDSVENGSAMVPSIHHFGKESFMLFREERLL